MPCAFWPPESHRKCNDGPINVEISVVESFSPFAFKIKFVQISERKTTLKSGFPRPSVFAFKPSLIDRPRNPALHKPLGQFIACLFRVWDAGCNPIWVAPHSPDLPGPLFTPQPCPGRSSHPSPARVAPHTPALPGSLLTPLASSGRYSRPQLPTPPLWPEARRNARSD